VDHVDSRCWYCPIGRYQNQAGKHECKACPDGKYNNIDGGASSCSTCPAAYYTGLEKPLTDTTKKKPTLNRYNPVCTGIGCGATNMGVVYYKCNTIACSAGEYPFSTNQKLCKSCPAGKYSNDDGTLITECKSCPAQYYQDEVGQTTCEVCASAKYATGSASTICAGTCTHSGCAAGKYQYSSGISSYNCNCYNCPLGMYQNQAAQTGCKDCTNNKYQSSNGQTTCESTHTVSCPSGKYRNVKAATTSCNICPAGYFQESVNQISCSKCPAGKYSLTTSTSTSHTSAPTKFPTTSPTSHPTPYPTAFSYTKYPTGAPTKFPTAYPTTNPTIFWTGCEVCPKGTYQDQEGQVYARIGAVVCKACSAAGKYQTSTGKTSCLHCSAGIVFVARMLRHIHVSSFLHSFHPSLGTSLCRKLPRK
jgi:hypothetical protein